MLSYYRMVVVKNCSPLSISDPSSDTKLSCIPKHIIPKIAEALDIDPNGPLTTVKKRIDDELKKSNCSGEWCYEFDMRIKEGLTDEEYEELISNYIQLSERIQPYIPFQQTKDNLIFLFMVIIILETSIIFFILI